MNLLSQAKKLPLCSGVYIFQDRKGKPLYIGRATSLRSRVLSYFHRYLAPRLKEMVSNSAQIRHKKTETILESVILEANLIKKHWPKYNVKERDNRSFIYIIIPKTDYPQPFIIRERELKKISGKSSYIFGPYQSYFIVKNALRIIRRLFSYSTCQPFSGQPCFDYQIGLCPGLCVGRISRNDYRKNIAHLVLLLKGKKQKLLKKLEEENPKQAQNLRHLEEAALISRERPVSLMPFNRIEGYDVSHFSGRERYGSMAVFINGEPENFQYRLFKIKKAPENDDLRALEEVILRRFRHPEWTKPDLILVDGGRPQVDYIFKALKNRHINIPLVGISKFTPLDSGLVNLTGFKKDKMVFSSGTKKTFKDLTEMFKLLLLEVRNEAHRFAVSASRRRRRIGRT